ncbi:peptidoglycan DD-metalloendopeptidase family protein [Metabacillus malikii]|uniref:Murein DD-endopeptidase MepM/ murein hydrolase activator NlpD n=1 Tax=Metabacillus malikii TaxID=1504265 RepID=A0ABT9ZN12_9BACI|nr:LysM peptidoglycan-binding domain-containing protein [Metabacillus malikii]MDQ0232923.1 murein DD-endopeptidase MepM/ murein hydrolase activator NlpD [Metabacillus malikii]
MLMIMKRSVFLVVVMMILTLVDINIVSAHTSIKEIENNWVQPVQGKITDTFGTRNGHHKGIDIAAPEGTNILSVSDGVVTKSYYSDSYGHVVFVKHPEGYETVYAHLSKRLVNEGESIKKGQTLGIIGNTGISTGTHLHFELHKGEWTVDKNHALDPFFVFQLTDSSVSASRQQETTSKKEVKLISAKNESDKKNHSNHNVIKVKKGDTLWRYSKKYNVSVRQIKEWNHIKSDYIYPGQEISIHSNMEYKYVVKSGDTLHSIANQYKTNPNQIMEKNDLKNETIYPNQVLVINPAS